MAETDWIGGDEAEAIARATEPQLLATPGVVQHIIFLEAGSSVFSFGGQSSALFRAMVPGLSQPLATIELFAGTMGLAPSLLQTTVTFATDPRLEFFDPVSRMPVSAAEVASMLRASELGTESGLSTRLPVFGFRYDLSETVLPMGASFGADGSVSAFVAPVPEPSTVVLLGSGGLALVVVNVWRRRRRSA